MCSSACRWSAQRSRSSANEIPDLLRSVLDPPLGDPPQGLAHDRTAHFAVASLPLGERDRNFDYAEARADRTPHEITLEAVALGGHRPVVDRVEDDPPVRARSAREILAS